VETSFDIFWNLYNLKKSREKVERKWNLMPAKDQQACLESLPAYIKDTPDIQYRKHPATYLNQKSWLDEQSTEQTLVYKMPKPPTLSNHKPESFDRSEFIATLRAKIKGYYEAGKVINDYGGAVTSFLVKQCKMTVPDHVKEDIERDCIQEKERERNRFEDRYSGTVEGDVRDLCLKWWLNSMKEQQIDVIELI